MEPLETTSQIIASVIAVSILAFVFCFFAYAFVKGYQTYKKRDAEIKRG